MDDDVGDDDNGRYWPRHLIKTTVLNKGGGFFCLISSNSRVLYGKRPFSSPRRSFFYISIKMVLLL